jgi:hypothetical protein
MTEVGWVNVDSAPVESVLLRSDRHGKLSPRPVAIKGSAKSGPFGIVGTEATFGTFPSETKLIMQTGQPKTVSAIIDEYNLEGLVFENVVQLHSAIVFAAAIHSFAAAVRRSASFFCGSAKFAARCRSRDVLDWKPKSVDRFCTFQKESQEIFCVMNEPSFVKATVEDWWPLVNDVTRVLSYSSEEETIQFDLNNAGFALWYLIFVAPNEYQISPVVRFPAAFSVCICS